MNYSHTRFIRFFVAFLLTMVLAPGAYAEIITYQVRGIVTTVVDMAGVNVNDPFSITFTFDSTASDLQAAAGSGQYRHNIGGDISATLIFGSVTKSATTFFDIIVMNNTFGVWDVYEVVFADFPATEFQFINQANLGWITSEAMPLDPLALIGETFSTNFARLGSGSDLEPGFAQGRIETWTELARIPEPSTYALIGIGLLGVARLGRQRRRTPIA